MLPIPPDKVQKLCFDFLWDRKRDKIQRLIAIHNASSGGINIPDIKMYIKALKLTWLRKRRNVSKQTQPKKHSAGNMPWNRLSQTHGPSMLTTKKVTNPFRINVFQASENLPDGIQLSNASELLTEPLFLNDEFKITPPPTPTHPPTPKFFCFCFLMDR